MQNKTSSLLFRLSCVLFFLPLLSLGAQTPVSLKNLQSLVKQKKADEALRMAVELGKDSLQQRNLKLHHLRIEAALQKYEKENEKLYLRRSPDTVAFFRSLYTAYEAALLADSLQTTGAFSPKAWERFKKKHASPLANLHGNLTFAVSYFVRHHHWKEALNYAEMSIRSGENSFLQTVDLCYSTAAKNQDAMQHLFAACQLRQFALAQRYAHHALQHLPNRETTLTLLCEANEAQRDSTRLYRYLRMGIADYPKNTFFQNHLSQYYFERQNVDAVLQFTTPLLAQDSLKLNLHHMQALAHLHKKDYPQLIASAQRMLRCDSLAADAYYYTALGYIEQAREIILPTSIRSQHYNSYHSQQQQLYLKARRPLERYKKMCPQKKERWASLLLEVYLKLNLNRAFEQLSAEIGD